MSGILAAIGNWLYVNTTGNLVASLIAWIVAASTAWFWKIRPHLLAQAAHRRAEAAHRATTATQLDALHAKVDALGDGTKP
jgi:hypothetical protein